MTFQMTAVRPKEQLIKPLQLNCEWAAIASISALLLSVLAFVPVQARSLTVEVQRTIPNGNLHLEPEVQINEDVVVMSGNVTLEKESRINGDLFVMSGNIEVAEEASIRGDVTAFSGNIKILGEVGGDIAALSGNIDLIDEAKVGGDISIISGKLKRDENTRVRGDIINGKGFDFGNLFGFATSEIADEVRSDIEEEIADAREEMEDEIASAQEEIEEGIASARKAGEGARGGEDRAHRRSRGIGSVISGIMGAIFKALALAAVAGAAAFIRPSFIKSIQRRLKDELALCFATGFAVNLALPLLALIITVVTLGIGALVTVPVLIALFLLNMLGAATAAAAVGERVVKKADISTTYPVFVGLGAATVILPIALLWSMGGCFSLLGFLSLFLLASIGTGALVLPWVRRFMGDAVPSQAPAQTVSENDTKADASFDDDEELDNEELDDEELDDDELDNDELDEPDEAPKPEKKARQKASKGDDLTQIRGIGAVFAARLRKAGINSYAELAAMTAEEIGDIFGWSADRVERDNIIAQAKALADE